MGRPQTPRPMQSMRGMTARATVEDPNMPADAWKPDGQGHTRTVAVAGLTLELCVDPLPPRWSQVRSDGWLAHATLRRPPQQPLCVWAPPISQPFPTAVAAKAAADRWLAEVWCAGWARVAG